MNCAKHPELAASFTCPRCGSFGCVDCERRSAMEAPPICPSCWARQGAAPPPSSGRTVLPTVGLVLGVASIIPCCPIAIVSLIVNAIAIVLAKEPAARAVRWRAVLGLVLSIVFGFLQALFIAFYQVFQHSTG
jgi:hypothetical protein